MRGKAVGFITLLLLLIATTSFAAVCPEVTVLGELTGADRFQPFRIAVDAGGNTYVTDAANDSVNLYDASGALVKSTHVTYPLGVAVDGSGNVYVGSSEKKGGAFKGSITVYNSGLTAQYSFGSNYLRMPLDIAVDANKVYVADSDANTVMVFNRADGTYLFSISATSGGKLINPDGVFITSTGNLIISDRALVYDYNVISDPAYIKNQLGQGAKLHEFTSTGTYVRSFVNPGYTETAGVIALIGGIAEDNAGRTFVSDRTKNSLHVFDNAGAAICIVPYTFTPGSRPQGLAATADGRLFVGASGRVIELGLDTFTKMVVSPSALKFSAQECGPQPSAKTVTISNEGPGMLSFTATSDQAWLTVSSASGSVNGVGSTDITASADKSGLAAGTYTGTITVASAGSTQTVSVTLEVLPPSTLTVSPSSLNFVINGSGNPAAQSLNIGLSGGGTWSATSDKAWLGVTPSGGASNVILTQVSVDSSTIGSDRAGSITVGGSCISGGPVVVPVTVNVISGGNIAVTTNNDSASFTVTGPAIYTGSGKTFSVSGAPAGTYKIEFGAVAGFAAPSSYSLSLTDGTTAAFSGNYRDLREKLNIVSAPGGISGSGTNDLNIFASDGTLLGSIPLVDPSTGKYYMENSIPAVGDVDGDGVDEVLVSHDVGVISGFEADGTAMPGLDFMPFADRAYVDMDLADVDGDGKAEIIVSALNWSGNGAAVRVFSYDGSGVVDTGVNFLAYTGQNWTWSQSNDRRGVRIAAGDIDGDGVDEILTVQGGGYSRHNVLARMFDVDASGGMGNWTVADAGSISVADMDSYYTDITAGDLDADGIDEIIISDAPALTAAAQDIRVLAYSSAGERLLDFTVNSIRGVEVAAGDLDYDGAAEIIVGEGAFREGDSSRVRVFDGSGSLKADFLGYGANTYGVRVATGLLIAY